MEKHPNVSNWQREHDGSYRSEVGGWQLVVKWRPESARHERGFFWEAERPTVGARQSGEEIHEEIEEAMAEAEEFARGTQH